MIIYKTRIPIANHIKNARSIGHSIGFVPTMGALHAGHISLIEKAKEKNDITVCSIFINPTQFNNKEDLKLYPVSLEKDIEKLLTARCDIVFIPAEDEIYNCYYTKQHYNLGRLEHLLEGEYRPGHFQGVCQVVHQLIDIIPANNLYLGQKDFQQCMVIKKLLELTGKEREISLQIVPTVRESNGLAMSSRNLRLGDEQRGHASIIYKVLLEIRNGIGQYPLTALKQNAERKLKDEGFKVDYIEIANTETLEPIKDKSESMVALIAVNTGSVRLIDNLLLN